MAEEKKEIKCEECFRDISIESGSFCPACGRWICNDCHDEFNVECPICGGEWDGSGVYT